MKKILVGILIIGLAIGFTSCNPSGMSASEVEKSNSLQNDTINYDGVYPPHDENVLNP